jgi:hypothetical protein
MLLACTLLPLLSTALFITPRVRQLMPGRLSSGHWGSCVVTDSGRLSCWGFLDRTSPAPDTAVNITPYALQISSPPNSTFRLVGVGGYGLCVLQASPDACACVNTGHFPFVCTLSTSQSAAAVAIAHGQDPWMMILDSSGTIRRFGGAPSYTPPGPPPTTGGWAELAAGWYHGCARSSRGNVECWGGNTGEASVPQRLNATMISSRDPYTCALLPDGSASCWGGSWCQPPMVPSLAGFNAVSIAAGGGATSGSQNFCRACALNSSGYLRCWASANAPTAAIVPPVHLQGDVVAVELGGTYSTCVARASTAGVECWAFSAPAAPSTMAQPNVNLTLLVPPESASGAFCRTFSAVLDDWGTQPSVCRPVSPSPTITAPATATPSPTATGSPTPTPTPSPSGSTFPGTSDSSTASPGSTPSGTPPVTPSSTPSAPPTASLTPSPSATVSVAALGGTPSPSPSPSPSFSCTGSTTSGGTGGSSLSPSGRGVATPSATGTATAPPAGEGVNAPTSSSLSPAATEGLAWSGGAILLLLALCGVAAHLRRAKKLGGHAKPLATAPTVELTPVTVNPLQQQQQQPAAPLAVPPQESLQVPPRTFWREHDATDEWFVCTSSGESVWALPPGAILVPK